MRIFSAEHDVGFARHARHVQRLDVEFAGERIQIFHDGADRLVAVPVTTRRAVGFGLLPDFWIRLLDNHPRIIRAREEKEMERMIVLEFHREEQIACDHPERRRHQSHRHFQG